MATVLERVPTGPGAKPLLPGDADWPLHLVQGAIDKQDEGTPDDWIPRHPDLVRLTGRHPFNCEPTLPELMSHGFITPVSLHYVRNHGPPPRLEWSTHTVTVRGLVDRPRAFSMDELAALPSRTIPCTLVCAGNRRKEQNMIKKTIGFNWGPAGHGTSYWTGVPFHEFLRLCGIKTPRDGAKFVAFRGPKGELPQGEDGSYGTSLTYEYAMDPANDVMIAYKQNGRYLAPDHGFPVRMIIPGFIGGRMVKFLEEIVVQSEESNNHYHYMDNRVLPPHVDAEKAKAEGWWYKPEYIINQLNIQSVISSPAHDEILSVTDDKPYVMKGYIFTGGGRKLIRMELSFDQGQSWELANLRIVEKPTEYGRYWCWAFWDMEVPTSRIANAKELWCRGWDEAQNTQPERLTWNLMGMMNNPVFRVKVHPATDSSGQKAVTFEQPTQPGARPGGWMVPKEGGAVAAAIPTPVVPAGDRKVFTMEEVEKHDTEESTWFVVDGKVYDSTRYNKDHPGGISSIVLAAGTDATDEFMSIHSVKAKGILNDYYIGDLAGEGAAAPAVPAPAPAADSTGTLTTLNPKKKVALPLIEKIETSHNTRIFRFGLPTKEHKLGLPVGQHFFVYAKSKTGGESIIRAYTPMTSDNVTGHVDLLVKVYWANEHPKFPEGGKMSQHLESLNLGETIEIKGPIGHFTYLGMGKCLDDKTPYQVKNFSMIAGGTGITPMWQVLSEVLSRPEDKTHVKLLFANQSEDDILLREELDALAAKHDNFEVWYTVDRAPEGWKFSQGFINEDMLAEHLHPAGQDMDTLCLMCGPPPMLNFACKPNLIKRGYTEEQMIFF